MGVLITPINMSLNNRYFHLLSICLGIFLLTSLSNAEQDFDFGDNEIKPINSRIEKYKVPYDDEDYLGDSSGFSDLEGSGEEVPYEVPDKTEDDSKKHGDNQAEYYRSSINITNIKYNRQFNDRNSATFKKYQKLLREAIESLFKSIEGTQKVTILEFRGARSLMVSFDLGTVGFYDKIRLFNVLNTAVNKKRIGKYRVSPIGFKFRELSGEPLFYFIEILFITLKNIGLLLV